MEISPVLIKQKTAMQMAGICSLNTLKKRIKEGRLPEPVFINGHRYYDYEIFKAACTKLICR